MTDWSVCSAEAVVTACLLEDSVLSKVFVIDDSVSVCVAVERMLGSQGFDVVWERDAITALQTVEKHLPDLVICDLVLPDISGYEVCQSLRGNPLLDNVPVLLISGNVDDAVRRRAKECDAAGVIAKPFTAELLVETVQATLGAVEPVLDEASWGGTPLVLRQQLTAELNFLSSLDYQFACVLDDEGRLVVATGRANPGTLPPTFRRELVNLGQLAMLAMGGPHGGKGGFRLTLETESGVRLVDDLGGGYLLTVALATSGSLGLTRFLMGKVGRSLAKILKTDSVVAPKGN